MAERKRTLSFTLVSKKDSRLSDYNADNINLFGDHLVAFKDLVQANLDSYNVLTKAIDLMDNPNLADRIRLIALRRAQNAEDLKRHIRLNDIEPKSSGSLGGFLREIWLACKTAISAGDRQVLFDELVKAEDAIHSAYGDAVKHLAGSEALSLIVEQYQVIGRDSGEIKAFRNVL